MYSRTSSSTVRTVRLPGERRGCPPVDLDTLRSPGSSSVRWMDPLRRGDAGATAADPGRHLPGHRRAGRGRARRRRRHRRADLRRARRGRRRARRRARRHGDRPRRQGRGPGHQRGPPTCTSRSSGILLAGAAYVPVDVDDPDERARLVFDEADVAAIVGNDQTVVMRRRGTAAGARGARARRRRVGDLHLRLDRHAQGGRGHPPQRGRVRRRRGADVPAGASRWGSATG